MDWLVLPVDQALSAQSQKAKLELEALESRLSEEHRATLAELERAQASALVREREENEAARERVGRCRSLHGAL